jgi:hypothetical protein
VRSLATLLVVLAVAWVLQPVRVAADLPTSNLPGIRPLGMGNAFVGVADDRNTLYYNPAGLATLRKLRLSGVGILAGMDDEFFEIVHFIQENEDQFADFETIDQEFYDSLAPYDDRWVAVDANAYVDVTRPGFGLGVYSTGRLQFKIDRGVYEPRVYADVRDDIVALIGGAMPLGRWDLRVGGAAKAIWRRESARALTAREVADFDPDEILNDLERAASGFALDLGVLWQRPGSSVTVGGVLRDAGFIGGEGIGAAIDLGTGWHALQHERGFLRELLVAFDLRDTFDPEVAFGKKINVGAELQLPVVTVRTGFHQGYPTAGVTLGFPVLSLDYAFFGRELGEFPGSEGQFLHCLEIRLGS